MLFLQGGNDFYLFHCRVVISLFGILAVLSTSYELFIRHQQKCMSSETNREMLPVNNEYEGDVKLTKVNTISKGLEDKVESASQTINSTACLVQEEQKNKIDTHPEKGKDYIFWKMSRKMSYLFCKKGKWFQGRG